DAFDIHYSSEDRDKLWLLILNPIGERLSEQFVTNDVTRAPNIGLGVATNPDSDVFITGQLIGTTLFTSNLISRSSYSAANAFAARRSATLQPELEIRQLGTNIELSWPRTSFHYALQQSDAIGSNW